MDERAKVLGYRMTSQCASGSGQFLENICRYLGITIDEIGPLSLAGRRSPRPARRSAPCSPRPTSSTWCRAGSRPPTSSRASTSRWPGATCGCWLGRGARASVLVTGGLAARRRAVWPRCDEAVERAESARRRDPRARGLGARRARWARRCGARSARASCARDGLRSRRGRHEHDGAHRRLLALDGQGRARRPARPAASARAVVRSASPRPAPRSSASTCPDDGAAGRGVDRGLRPRPTRAAVRAAVRAICDGAPIASTSSCTAPGSRATACCGSWTTTTGRDVLRVNLDSAFYLLRAAAPLLRAERRRVASCWSRRSTASAASSARRTTRRARPA